MNFAPLFDNHQRKHNYLRISVTDHCNLRCVYCMPAQGLPFTPNDHLLTNAEIASVVRLLAKRGVSRLRITGGEPLVRPQLVELIAELRAIPGIEDIIHQWHFINKASTSTEKRWHYASEHQLGFVATGTLSANHSWWRFARGIEWH
jgi:organic radical activating enzyme